VHEKILQGLTIGVVGGLIVYWLTSRKQTGFQDSSPKDYAPLLGDVRAIRGGMGTSADCECCGLCAPNATPYPLATDYLDGAPEYAPATSDFNLGISIQVTCGGVELDSKIYRQETATSFPHGLNGPNSVPRPVVVAGSLSCNPDVPLQVDCTEIV
jgi:hypothetical protein